MPRRAVSPVIAIVLLLMMTVAAAGAAYFWLTSMQSSMQESSRKSIENIMEASGRRVTAQATLCKPTYPYEGLKGYWMMDEGSGSYANDSSGNGNDGTLYPGSDGSITSTSGMWNESGQVGGALKFDGNDSYVKTNDFDFWEHPEKGLTISIWIKTNFSSSYGSRVGICGESYVSSFMINYDYRIPVIRSYIGDESGDYHGPRFPNTYSFSKGALFHLVLTYDGKKLKTYTNGTLGWSLQVDMNNVDKTFLIGSYHNLVGVPFKGIIDEVRIYDRALSKDEVKTLYQVESHSARRRIDVTVRNIGSEEIPKATWVANLKQDGTTVETDAYNASSIGTGELKTLKFYFKNFKPNTEYTIDLQGTGTSTTVSC